MAAHISSRPVPAENSICSAAPAATNTSAAAAMVRGSFLSAIGPMMMVPSAMPIYITEVAMPESARSPVVTIANVMIFVMQDCSSP